MAVNGIKAVIITTVFIFVLMTELNTCFTIKENENFLENPKYHSQKEIEDEFIKLEKQYKPMAKIHIIGKSRENRNLIALEIGPNTDKRPELVPMIKLIANMHGDETVGRELLIYMAKYLLWNYNKVPEVTKLVNTTEIYLLPSMNPDGYTRSLEGTCKSRKNYVGRFNSVGVDLNRNFPDRLTSKNEPDNAGFYHKFDSLLGKSEPREPEVVAIMRWILENPFVLSANLHGGAVVASYPYDNSKKHRECCEDSLSPDDRVFKMLASTYAQNHPNMKTGLNCNDTFPGGITNGANWYELNGGMQDFNYAFSNCFEVTLELSCCKFPPITNLSEEWYKNKKSLMEYMKLAHMGVKGFVRDNVGRAIPNAEIYVENLEEKPIRTTLRGEYWRLLVPGIYNIKAIAPGYEGSQIRKIEINNHGTLRLDFTLKRRPIQFNNGIPFYYNRFLY